MLAHAAKLGRRRGLTYCDVKDQTCMHMQQHWVSEERKVAGEVRRECVCALPLSEAVGELHIERQCTVTILH